MKHSHPVDGGRGVWEVERLWPLIADLPVEEVAIADIPEFDRDCWFSGGEVTCRMVAEHARRIRDADLSHPVIFSAHGWLMDGGHRISKAWLDGATTVRAVRFVVDPAPDRIEPYEWPTEHHGPHEWPPRADCALPD